jgi:hypothetical protein
MKGSSINERSKTKKIKINKDFLSLLTKEKINQKLQKAGALQG